MLDIGLINQCASAMPPITANSIVKQESSFNPHAIGVAGGLKNQPKSYAVAVATAKDLIKKGYNIDMGLGQINSLNLPKFGLSVEQVFEPCTNVNAMQRVFVGCYNGAKKLTTDNQLAIRMAFSCYNTGNYSKGFKNGYVGKILRNHDYFRGVIPAQQQYAVSKTPTYIAKSVLTTVSPNTVSVQPVKVVSKPSVINTEVTPAITVSVKQNPVQTQNLDQFIAKDDTAVATTQNPVIDNEKTYQSWDVFKNF